MDANKGASRRARIETILADYPNVAEDQAEELHHFFKREAAAIDLAMIASNERVRPGYERYRAEHIDRFKPADILRAMIFVLAFAGIVAAIAWHTA